MSAAAVPEKSGEPHASWSGCWTGSRRAGNKMPNPAILFLALCVVVILLSQVLYWFDVKATYQVVEPPPVVAEEIYVGGSIEADRHRAGSADSPPRRTSSRPRRRRSRAS